MPVGFPLKPQHPKMSPDIVNCPLGDHIPPTLLENCWFASQQDGHCNSWVLLPPGKECGPCCCHSGCLLQMACQRGEHICPRGPQGPVSAMFSPLPLPYSFFHACTRGLKVSTLHPLPGFWPVCQLQSPQLASSGRRANIYSSEAHGGPHRRTKDWGELATHPNRGLSLLFSQAPGLG